MENAKYCILDFNKIKNQFSEKTDALSPFSIGIPLLDLSEESICRIYYFRWNTFCKHIRSTPQGFVITEFLPNVPWAGKYNTISCPAGHHFYEGRWLHDRKYLNDYAYFWFTKDAQPRLYSFWAANAIYAFCSVSGDFSAAETLFEPLKQNYAAWEKSNQLENGLFYQTDDRDGMEYSAGGSGCRPTINSYMYGDATAIAKIAKRLGARTDTVRYTEKAEALKTLINTKLWDKNACFYKTLSKEKNYSFADVREQIGYVPWYFNIPESDKADAWQFLMDKDGFYAPFGPTTAEQKYPDFMRAFDHECLWNGPSWPYATSQTLTALGNLLSRYRQNVLKKSDYFSLLKLYAHAQYITADNGNRHPFIDENLDPYTGEWLARKKLHSINNPPGGADRGKDYNHSSFCDLILSGLAGIRARDDNVLEVNPMFEASDLTYFCADGILYHGHFITVLWDKTGNRYGKGNGFYVYCDGKRLSAHAVPTKTEMNLK